MGDVPLGHDLPGLGLIPPQAWRPFHLVTLPEIDHELRHWHGNTTHPTKKADKENPNGLFVMKANHLPPRRLPEYT